MLQDIQIGFAYEFSSIPKAQNRMLWLLVSP